MSDLGESPTLRDAIADALTDWLVAEPDARIGEDAWERGTVRVESAVRTWHARAFNADLVARGELVVPSPQPADDEERVEKLATYLRPFLVPAEVYAKDQSVHEGDRVVARGALAAVSPLPETEQT